MVIVMKDVIINNPKTIEINNNIISFVAGGGSFFDFEYKKGEQAKNDFLMIKEGFIWNEPVIDLSNSDFKKCIDEWNI